MGLKGSNVLLNNGLIANEIYARIDSLYGKKEFILAISLYASREAFLNKKPSIGKDEHLFIYDNLKPNIIQQAYNYLKTLDKYQGWEDVLEEDTDTTS